MEGCTTQHAVIDALKIPGSPPVTLPPREFVISSIKIISRHSYVSDVIGPLKTLWNLLKANFIMWEMTLEQRQAKKCRAFQK